MHLSGDATHLLFKCTILTAMMRRLTSLVWSYFPQISVSGKQNQSQKVVKRGMYRMRRLILIFDIRTCYKCHFSYTRTAQLDPDHTACVTKFTL